MDTTKGTPRTKICIALVTLFLIMCADAQDVSHIPLTDNLTTINEINTLLHAYRFDTPYAVGEFDCMESSYAVWSLLREHGYDARVMYRIVPIWSFDDSHAWCVVRVDDAYAVIETTLWAGGYDGIGGVVIPEDAEKYKTDTGYMTDEPREYLNGYGFGNRLNSDIGKHVVMKK